MSLAVHGIFCRFEAYALVAAARKSGGNTLAKVASEAMRVEGFCDHVHRPRSPSVVFGESPLALPIQLQARQRTMVTQYWHRPSQSYRTRQQRVDRPLAVAGVISVPPDWKETEPRWQRFTEACVEWLQEQFGEGRLRSVVEHLDEGCLHLHVFLVPLADEDVGAVHPGFSAQRVLGVCATPSERVNAYRSAMSSLLDDFHERVGNRFGLVRKHIGAKRMTRKQWHIWKWYRNRALLPKDLAVDRALNATSSQGCSVGLTVPVASVATDTNAVGFLVARRTDSSDGVNGISCGDLEPNPAYSWVRPRQS